MDVPAELKYSEEHLWVRVAGDQATFGITGFAQDSLGDLVFVELPAVGSAVTAGKSFGVVESVKSVSDLYAPLSGTVVAINETLPDAPERINNDPYGDGWLITIRMDNPARFTALLDADAYLALVAAAG